MSGWSMTDRVLAGVAVAGVVAAIALGTRQELIRDAEPAPTDTLAATPSPAAFPVPAGPGAASRPADDRGPGASGLVASSPPAVVAAAGATAPPPAGAQNSAPVQADATASSQADAEALLRRASEAYGRVRSLSAAFAQVMRNPLLGSTTSSRGMLYQRRPDRFAMRFSEPAGDVIVSDGRYFWVYYPSADPRQVIRTPAAAGAAGGGVDLQSQFMGDAVRRFNATLTGRESVAGRQAYVLRLVPRSDAGYQQLKVWLDPVDHLARRFEIAEQNGSVRRFDLSRLRVNPALGDDLFRFTPPPGAQVIAR
jgi:outer membrane lipoprotein carrier protein